MTKPSVLVVDDEPNITDSFVEFMGRKLNCYGVYSYDEAINYLKKNKVDLVITDINLPGKDGFELLLWIKKNRPEIKVILITAYGSSAFKEKARKNNAFLYLEKPVDLKQLMRIIGKLFQKKGFNISIQNLRLADILQLISFQNTELVLSVENSIGIIGEIGIKQNYIMWAKTEFAEGESALKEMLSWEGGSFNSKKYKENKKGEINKEIQYLLLEFAKEEDEKEKKENDAFINSIEKIKGGETMSKLNVQKVLEQCGEQIPELITTFVANIGSGLNISEFSLNDQFDVSVSSAIFAEVLKQNQKALELLGSTPLTGEPEDILITTDKIYILLRQLGENHYHGVITTKKGNLGLARIIMKKYEIDLLETLKELEEL